MRQLATRVLHLATATAPRLVAASVVTPTNLAIKYFDIQGPAEPSRLALAIGGVPFDDIRVTFDEFKAMKSSLPSGQLPLLEADGEILTQSMASARADGRGDARAHSHLNVRPHSHPLPVRMCAVANYCAKLAGLWPQDALAQARCDQVVQIVLQDIRERAIAPTMSRDLSDEDKLSKRKELAETKLPEKLAYLESLLSPSGYFVGDAVTVADLHVYVLLNWLGMETLDGVPKGVVTAHEKLTAFVKKMDAIPEVADWNAKKNPNLPWL